MAASVCTRPGPAVISAPSFSCSSPSSERARASDVSLTQFGSSSKISTGASGCVSVRSHFLGKSSDCSFSGSSRPLLRGVKCKNLKEFRVLARAEAQNMKEPLRIMIAGAPASGKGTQCELIVEKYGLTHISAGDLLRAEVAVGSENGKLAKEYMTKGLLVPSEIVVKMVIDRLAQQDAQENGWLLDGYPRSAEQAQALEVAGIRPDLFILLDVEDEILIQRVVNRRMDPVTGKIYHLLYSPPENEEIAGRLTQRFDDTEEKARVRLATHYANVEAVLGFYKGVIQLVDGNRPKLEVFAEIDKLLVDLLKEESEEGCLYAIGFESKAITDIRFCHDGTFLPVYTKFPLILLLSVRVRSMRANVAVFGTQKVVVSEEAIRARRDRINDGLFCYGEVRMLTDSGRSGYWVATILTSVRLYLLQLGTPKKLASVSTIPKQDTWRGIPTKMNTTPHTREMREYFYKDVCSATKRAVENNITKLKITLLIPELNPEMDVYRIGTLLELMRELAFTFADDGKRVRVCVQGSMGEGIFAGMPLQLAGTRQLLERMDWGENDVKGTFVNFGAVGAKEVKPEDDMFILMAPQNAVGNCIIDDLKAMVEAAGDRTVIIINPRLKDLPGSGGNMQIQGRDKRMEFAASFFECYHFRLLYQSGYVYPILGALRMAYPNPYEVFKRVDLRNGKEEYVLLDTFEEEPTRSEIGDAYYGRPRKDKNAVPEGIWGFLSRVVG